MSSYKPVTAALRVLDVLAAVNRLGTQAKLAELHFETGLDKATTLRMLETLTHAGYLLRDQDRATYRPTGKTLSLSSAYDRHVIASNLIGDDLIELRQRIGWPSDVALMDRDAMLVVKSSRHSEPLHLQRATGFRAPLLVTSLGLAYLAACPAPEREYLIEQAAQDPARWNDLARKRDVLDARLNTIREQGYAVMDESYSRGVYDSQFLTIGVAIRCPNQVFGAINTIYLRSALSSEEAREKLLEPLTQLAAALAQKFEGKLPLD